MLPRLQRLSAPILAAAVITSFAGCGRGGAPEAKRVLEREETVAGVPVRLRSELQPSRGTLGDPLAWRLSAQLGPGMKAESLRVAPAPAGLDLEEPRDRAAPAGTKRAVFTRELRVRGFDLGPITLPAATLWVRSRARRDTLEFPRDTLFVDSLTPAASGSIRPDRGPIEPALRPLDYAVLILVLALAAGLVFVLARALLRARRTRSAPAPAPPPVPPEETLRAALDELERELGTLPRDIFYERLSLALRAYAAAVAGAPALDYTTTELERDLAAREGVAPEGRRLLIETLRRADLAKFARYEDAESDARSILRAARDISGILVSPRPPDPAPGSRG